MSVTAAGSVTGSGGHGIHAAASAAGGGGIWISAADVSGRASGIYARTGGGRDGDISISVSGTVRGGDGASRAAIRTVAPSSRKVTVDLLSGADVGADGRLALLDGAADATVTLHSGALIAGTVSGGTGLDALAFGAGASGVLTSLSGFETVSVASGASVRVKGRVSSIRSLTVQGSLSFQDGLPADQQIGFSILPGRFAGGGAVTLDVSFVGHGQHDKLVVYGDVTGVTAINVAKFGARNVRSSIRLPVVQVMGTGSVDPGAFAINTGGYALSFDRILKTFFLTQAQEHACVERPAGSGVFHCEVAHYATHSLRTTGSTTLDVRLAS